MSSGRLYVSWVAVIVGMMINSAIQGASASGSVTLAWDPNPGNTVVGYHLYVGGASRNYTNMIDTGSATSGTVSGLVPGKTYYFAVTAYDVIGLESPAPDRELKLRVEQILVQPAVEDIQHRFCRRLRIGL